MIEKRKTSFSQRESEPATAVASWEAELATRLTAVVDQLGQDTSVRITGKSWKQIRRYCDGAEPPASVLKALADASRVSIAYLVDGAITVTEDAEIERSIIDLRLSRLRTDMEKNDRDDLSDLMHEEKTLLDRSAFFAKIGASLLNRGKYPRSYKEYLDLDFNRHANHVDPTTVREIHEYHGIPTGLSEEPAVYHGGALPEGFILVPRYDVEASAGPGALTEREHVIDYMAFQEGWVRRSLGLDPQGLALISAKGDSMEPAIRAGDLLLVDTSVNEVEDDAIYILVMDGHLVVKRLQRFVGGAVSVKSDNAAYVEQTLSAEELSSYATITGRVRWIGRMI